MANKRVLVCDTPHKSYQFASGQVAVQRFGAPISWRHCCIECLDKFEKMLVLEPEKHRQMKTVDLHKLIPMVIKVLRIAPETTHHEMRAYLGVSQWHYSRLMRLCRKNQTLVKGRRLALQGKGR